MIMNMFNGSLFKGTVYMVFLFALQLQTTCFSQKLSKVNFDILSSTANATLCFKLELQFSFAVDSFVIRHKGSKAIVGDAL